MSGAGPARWFSRETIPRDRLTGLSGRDDLLARGSELLGRAGAAGRTAVLLLLDLDGFKSINDSVGHHAGDQVLAEVAERLRRAVGPDDLVVRLGGDEFVVLTQPTDDAQAGATHAEAIIEAVARPVVVDDLRLPVGVSVGVATYPVDGPQVEDLVRAADQAMYAAKHEAPGRGAGQWRSSSPEGQDHDQTERLLRDLSSGVVVDQLVVHYQPQVDLGTGAVVGFEALARWDHPRFGLLLPRQFVPLAERSGLMAPITTTVLDIALGDLGGLQQVAPDARLAINVARRNLVDEGLGDDLGERVRRHGVEPRHVVLEVTDPIVRASSENAASFGSLSTSGFGVSIRGFGTSRSSLAAFWSNPVVREVKLDPAVVRTLRLDEGHDPEAGRLLRALTTAARELGIRVVAEGVEDRVTVRALRELRCDVAQGFWIGPPADRAHTEVWCLGWPGRSSGLLA